MTKNQLNIGVVILMSFYSWAGVGQVCNIANSDIIQNMQDVACATADLQTAVQRNNLLKKVSLASYFEEFHPLDVVRTEETLSFFDRSLKDKIEDTHNWYQNNQAKDRYTLSIVSYPSKVEEDSCPNHKTIDFRAVSQASSVGTEQVENPLSIKNIYQEYSTVPGREPLSFSTRKYDGDWVICENSNKSKAERIVFLCGQDPSRSCKSAILPACQEIDKKGAELSGPQQCLSLDDFGEASADLLMYNDSLDTKYCPDGCSYYTQTVQAVYKEQGNPNKYCADSHLIIHCGPAKDTSDYNLNIREIKDLCSDFGVCI